MVKLSKYEADLIFERAELAKCKAELEQLRQHDKEATYMTIDQAQEIGRLRATAVRDALNLADADKRERLLQAEVKRLRAIEAVAKALRAASWPERQQPDLWRWLDEALGEK